MLVSLGLRPSLACSSAQDGAAARVAGSAVRQGQSHGALRALRALAQGSAARLPVMAHLGGQASLSGWRLRILDGNHCPRARNDWRRCAIIVVQPAGTHAGGLRPRPSPGHGHCGLRGCARERAYRGAGAGGLCTGGRAVAGRQPFLHPCPAAGLACRRGAPSSCASMAAIPGWCSAWAVVHEAGRCETGVLKEQSIGIEAEGVAWRRIQLVLDEPTREGLTQLNLWSNLPPRSRPSRLPSCTCAVAHRRPVRANWNRFSTARNAHAGPSTRGAAGLCHGGAGLQRVVPAQALICRGRRHSQACLHGPRCAAPRVKHLERVDAQPLSSAPTTDAQASHAAGLALNQHRACPAQQLRGLECRKARRA